MLCVTRQGQGGESRIKRGSPFRERALRKKRGGHGHKRRLRIAASSPEYFRLQPALSGTHTWYFHEKLS